MMRSSCLLNARLLLIILTPVRIIDTSKFIYLPFGKVGDIVRKSWRNIRNSLKVAPQIFNPGGDMPTSVAGPP